MGKKRESTGGIMYSTDPDFKFSTPTEESRPATPQDLRVMLDKKQRAGKSVTLITGYQGSTLALETLTKKIKVHCGVGGTCKEGIIIIQGDFRIKIMELLKKEGFKAKQAGGP